MMRRSLAAALILFLAVTLPAWAEGEGRNNEEEAGPMSSGTFSGLKLRCVGPAGTSGRVGDFAVNPEKPWEYYVAVCSGNV